MWEAGLFETTAHTWLKGTCIKVLVSQQLNFFHTNIRSDIIVFIDITIMILMTVNTSFIIRFRTAEWEKERELNKTGEVNTALIITTNKQPGEAGEQDPQSNPFSLSSNCITVCAYLNE